MAELFAKQNVDNAGKDAEYEPWPPRYHTQHYGRLDHGSG